MINVWGDRYFECGSCDHVWKIKTDRIVRPDETNTYLPTDTVKKTPAATVTRKRRPGRPAAKPKPKQMGAREAEAEERRKKIESFASLSRKEQKAAIKGESNG